MDHALGGPGRGRPLPRVVRHRGRALLAASAALLLLLLARGPAQAEPSVVATTPDLKSLAEAVAVGVVRVESLVPPGADAEAFAPRPSHLALVRGASLVLRVGLGYDEWLDRLLAQAGQERLRRGGEGHLDLSPTVALLEVQGRSVEARSGHAHGAANPHYWLDPANAEPMSAAIAEALVRLVPERRREIEAAQARFVADLRVRLDAWTARLAPHRGKALVAYHNSWPYFARRFRLNIVEVIEPKEGVPASPARLAALAASVRESRARAILHEATAPDAASRALAARTGIQVVPLAPSVGAAPGTGSYLALFDRNVALLAAALD